MERTSGHTKVTSLGGLARALLAAMSLAPALQAQTLILSKEYIRLGGSILAIEQASWHCPRGYSGRRSSHWPWRRTTPNPGCPPHRSTAAFRRR